MERTYIVTVEGDDLCSINIPRTVSHAIMEDTSVSAESVNVEPLDMGFIALPITTEEMVVISCSMAGMRSELTEEPSSLETCVETFKYLTSKGVTESLRLRIIDICKRELKKTLKAELNLREKL